MTILMATIVFTGIVALSFYLAWKSMTEAAPIAMGMAKPGVLIELTHGAPSVHLIEKLHKLTGVSNASISFELLWRKGTPTHFLYVPQELLPFIKNDPGLRPLTPQEDYASYLNPNDHIYAAAEFSLKEGDSLPVEPEKDLSAIVSHFQEGDSLWFQITASPVDTWSERKKEVIQPQKTPKEMLEEVMGDVITGLMSIITGGKKLKLPVFWKKTEQNTPSQEVENAITRKKQSAGYKATIRMVVINATEKRAQELLQETAVRLTEVTSDNKLNKLIKTSELMSHHGVLYAYRKRYLEENSASILTVSELDRLFNWKPSAETVQTPKPVEIPVVQEEPMIKPQLAEGYTNSPVIEEPKLVVHIPEPEITKNEEMIKESEEIPSLQIPVKGNIYGEIKFRHDVKPEEIAGEIKFA